MLDQRSEVEQFFLEALEQIKEEIRKKNIIEKKQKRQVSNPMARTSGDHPDGTAGIHGVSSSDQSHA